MLRCDCTDLPTFEVASLGEMRSNVVDDRFQHAIVSSEGVKIQCTAKVQNPGLQRIASLGRFLGGDCQSDVTRSSAFQLWRQHGWQGRASRAFVPWVASPHGAMEVLVMIKLVVPSMIWFWLRLLQSVRWTPLNTELT